MALTKVRTAGIDYAGATFIDTTNSGSITLDFSAQPVGVFFVSSPFLTTKNVSKNALCNW